MSSFARLKEQSMVPTVVSDGMQAGQAVRALPAALDIACGRPGGAQDPDPTAIARDAHGLEEDGGAPVAPGPPVLQQHKVTHHLPAALYGT